MRYGYDPGYERCVCRGVISDRRSYWIGRGCIARKINRAVKHPDRLNMQHIKTVRPVRSLKLLLRTDGKKHGFSHV